MKKLSVALCLLGLVATSVAQGQDKADKNNAFKNDDQKTAYAIGLNIGKSMKAQGVQVDVDTVIEGLRDGYSGANAKLTDQELKETLMAFQKNMMAKMQAERKAEAGKNMEASKAFLEKNKARKGVMTLADGLQYEVLKAGNGPKPSADDTVTVNYTGTLIDGTKFDSSYDRGKPATFPVKAVIKGWQEALQMMPVGSKWKIYLPPELGYGERGAGHAIGPDAALIFEVEMLGIKPKDEKTGGAKPQGNMKAPAKSNS